MSDLFIKHLNKLSEIEPDANFKVRSRELILSSPMLWESPVKRFSLGQVLANSRLVRVTTVSVFAVFVLALGFYGLNSGSDAVLALDETNLSDELATLSINVKLEQVNYNQKIQETVAMAVTEITTKQVQNAGPIISAENGAMPEGILDRNQQIDELLKEVIF